MQVELAQLMPQHIELAVEVAVLLLLAVIAVVQLLGVAAMVVHHP
jgi:hypothetical protein